jgi:hypothetical protein
MDISYNQHPNYQLTQRRHFPIPPDTAAAEGAKRAAHKYIHVAAGCGRGVVGLGVRGGAWLDGAEVCVEADARECFLAPPTAPHDTLECPLRVQWSAQCPAVVWYTPQGPTRCRK